MVVPIQSGVTPVTEATLALGLTVTVCCAEGVPLHPPVMVKMILDVPADTAVTTPDAEFTVAMAVLLLLQDPVPPPSTAEFAVYVAVAPVQSGVVPVTEATLALGLTVRDCKADTVPPQPPVMVKMILVVPAVTDVTTPDAEFTVATAVLLLLQVPVPPESTTEFAV